MDPSTSTAGKLSNHQSTLPTASQVAPSHGRVTAESRPSGKLSNHQSTLRAQPIFGSRSGARVRARRGACICAGAGACMRVCH